MNSIGFLETLLQYYLPGLDVSSLTDDEFAVKCGWLEIIREMERVGSIDDIVKKLMGRE